MKNYISANKVVYGSNETFLKNSQKYFSHFPDIINCFFEIYKNFEILCKKYISLLISFLETWYLWLAGTEAHKPTDPKSPV